MIQRILLLTFLACGAFVFPTFAYQMHRAAYTKPDGSVGGGIADDRRRAQNQVQNIEYIRHRTVSYPVYRNYPRSYPFNHGYYDRRSYNSGYYNYPSTYYDYIAPPSAESYNNITNPSPSDRRKDTVRFGTYRDF